MILAAATASRLRKLRLTMSGPIDGNRLTVPSDHQVVTVAPNPRKGDFTVKWIEDLTLAIGELD